MSAGASNLSQSVVHRRMVFFNQSQGLHLGMNPLSTLRLSDHALGESKGGMRDFKATEFFDQLGDFIAQKSHAGIGMNKNHLVSISLNFTEENAGTLGFFWNVLINLFDGAEGKGGFLRPAIRKISRGIAHRFSRVSYAESVEL